MRPNFFKRLFRAFHPLRPLPPWPALGDERAIAARYARGNVLLQMGRMQTVAEYEEQKRRVLNHAF